MNINMLHQLLKDNSKNKTEEYTRLFHGRGHFYNAYNFLTIDSVDQVLYAAFLLRMREKKHL